MSDRIAADVDLLYLIGSNRPFQRHDGGSITIWPDLAGGVTGTPGSAVAHGLLEISIPTGGRADVANS